MINALLENPGVAETGMALTNFVCDEQRRAFLEAREKNRRDLADIELGGFQRGVELGEKRGEKRGLKRGVELGEKRGALRGKIQLIIELLLLKTNSEIPNSLQETLYKIDDPAVLKSLFVQAMSVSSIAEFEKAMENAGLN